MLLALLLHLPRNQDPWGILQACIGTYQTLNSYSDEGSSTVQGPNGPETYPLNIKFLRGRGGVVVWQTRGERETLWSEKGQSYRLVESRKTDDKPDEVVAHLSRYKVQEDGNRLPDPDQSRTRWIGDLLVSNLEALSPLEDRDRSLWKTLSPQRIDGASCDVVVRDDVPYGVKLFIDAKTHLVRRVEARNNGAIPTVVQLKPRPNVKVAEREVAFRPPLYKCPKLPDPDGSERPGYTDILRGAKTFEDFVARVSDHYLRDNMTDDFTVSAPSAIGPGNAITKNHFIRRTDGAFQLTTSGMIGGSSAIWSNGKTARQWSLMNSFDVSLYSIDRSQSAANEIGRTLLSRFTEWPLASTPHSQAIAKLEVLETRLEFKATEYLGKRAFQVTTYRRVQEPGSSRPYQLSMRWWVDEEGLPLREEWRKGADMSSEPYFTIDHRAKRIRSPRWSEIDFRPPPADLWDLLQKAPHLG